MAPSSTRLNAVSSNRIAGNAEPHATTVTMKSGILSLVTIRPFAIPHNQGQAEILERCSECDTGKGEDGSNRQIDTA